MDLTNDGWSSQHRNFEFEDPSPAGPAAAEVVNRGVVTLGPFIALLFRGDCRRFRALGVASIPVRIPQLEMGPQKASGARPRAPTASHRPPGTLAFSTSKGLSLTNRSEWRYRMLYWAVIFLVVALIAGVLGFSGIAGVASNIAWILFIVGLVLAVIFFIRGRRPVP